MRLKYGTYWFDANGTNIQARTEVFRNEAGIPFKRKSVIQVSGFMEITGSTVAAMQSDATTKISAMQTALSKPYQNLIFYQDSGAESATYLKQANSIDGVVIVDGPNFPNGADGSRGYTNVQDFNFRAEAEYYIPATSGINVLGLLYSFTETLSFSGGKPRIVFKEAIRGLPQKQLAAAHTTYRVTQRGSAVGILQYPTPPAPIWPGALLPSEGQVEKTTPKLMGLRNHEMYGVTWSYQFASATPLVGNPTLWFA